MVAEQFPLRDHEPGSVMLVGGDPLSVQEVTRLAAAAGVVPTVVSDPVVALGMWPHTGTVLVAEDVTEAMARLAPSRRPRVHVVCRGPATESVWRPALALGAESVAELPDAQSRLVAVLTDAGDGGQLTGRVIGVLGGSGGVGASVFASGLAESLAVGGRPLLVDADPQGAGLDRLLGMEDAPGIRWDALGHSTGRLSGRSMRDALPSKGGLAVLTWTPDAPAELDADSMREVLSAGSRGFDVVVVDLPRARHPVVTESLSRVDHVLVVVAASVGGVAAATRLVRRLPSATRPHLVVRTRRGGVPAEEVGQVLAAPVVAELPDDRGLDEALDLGAGPVRSKRSHLARACSAVRLALDLP